ncbi:MAG: polysaccharide deacetylase family protein [Bacteroidota bacterium]|nr:polysaccharide deacetylase family protein [Bacteroidota bacterium]
MKSIKKAIDSTLIGFIEKLGLMVNPIILNFKDTNSHLLIFYFHGLYESQSQKELNHIDPQNNLTVSQFTEFIDYFLYHNYHFIKPKDLLTDLPNDQSYAMITFDDGYFNNTLAIDVLNKYNIPATFFVTTKNIFENKSFWWDIIYKFRMQNNTSLRKIRKEQEYLKKFKHEHIEKYIETHFGTKATKPWSDIDRPLNPVELKQISEHPLIAVGNHTHNHSILTNHNDEELKKEFEKSNKLLFDLTGLAPISIAYPNGNFNKSILKITEKSGFQFAFTTQNGINILPTIDNKIISLKRFMPKPVSIKDYGSFVRLGYSPDIIYLNFKKQIKSFMKK